MKKILVLIIILFSIHSFGQVVELPKEVLTSFKAKYPTSKLNDRWFENTLYHINFTLNPTSYTAVYDEAGSWKETSEIISDFDIPASLSTNLKQNFPEGKISFCE